MDSFCCNAGNMEDNLCTASSHEQECDNDLVFSMTLINIGSAFREDSLFNCAVICYIHRRRKTGPLTVRHSLSTDPLTGRHSLSTDILTVRHSLSTDPLTVRHSLSTDPLTGRHSLSIDPLTGRLGKRGDRRPGKSGDRRPGKSGDRRLGQMGDRQLGQTQDFPVSPSALNLLNSNSQLQERTRVILHCCSLCPHSRSLLKKEKDQRLFSYPLSLQTFLSLCPTLSRSLESQTDSLGLQSDMKRDVSPQPSVWPISSTTALPTPPPLRPPAPPPQPPPLPDPLPVPPFCPTPLDCSAFS